MGKEGTDLMTTITTLINEAKHSAGIVANLKHYFTELEIAGITYNGKLIVRRMYSEDYAWGAFAFLDADLDGRQFAAHEDSAGTALDQLKEQMFDWARAKEEEPIL